MQHLCRGKAEFGRGHHASNYGYALRARVPLNRARRNRSIVVRVTPQIQNQETACENGDQTNRGDKHLLYKAILRLSGNHENAPRMRD